MTVFDDGVVPVYEQVKRYITDHIQSGKWEAGQRVPSEIELIEQLGVSKMTVNRAMRELMAAGIIVRRQGVGSFVSKTKPRAPLIEMRDIAEEIEARGNRHDADMKLLETIILDNPIADAIGMRPGLRVFHSVIVHRENGTPVQLEERWIDPTVFPNYIGVDFSKVTPYRYLRGSVDATEIEHVIHAVMPDPDARALLELQPSEPCLLMFRRTWAGDALATSSQFLYPGSGYALGSRHRLDGSEPRPASMPLGTRIAGRLLSHPSAVARSAAAKKKRRGR